MRSQKKTNKAPRPFKSHADRWSGKRGQEGFIPGAKPAPRPKKLDAASAELDPSKSQAPKADCPPTTPCSQRTAG